MSTNQSVEWKIMNRTTGEIHSHSDPTVLLRAMQRGGERDRWVFLDGPEGDDEYEPVEG